MSLFLGGGSGGSVLMTVKNLAVSLLSSGRTRLELLGNEIEAQKLRAIRLLLLAQASAFFFALSLLLTLAVLVLCFWENRALLLGIAAAFSLICAFSLYWGFRCLLNKRTAYEGSEADLPMFAASLAALEEDIRQLNAAVRDERHESQEKKRI
ncbi:MAG: phage holin family protein [Pseudomonadota bacterium]